MVLVRVLSAALAEFSRILARPAEQAASAPTLNQPTLHAADSKSGLSMPSRGCCSPYILLAITEVP